VRYQPVFRDYVSHYLELLVKDGVQHVELRSISSGLYDLQHPEGYFNADSTVRYIQEAAGKIRQKEPAFTLKIIYTSLRFRSQDQVLQDLVTAYEMRRHFPDLVKGFDLVAEEDQGNSTLYFLETWIKMDSLNQVYGVDMPLYLHDGESDWVSSRNLYDAVLLNSRRIGHGFNLFRYPNLLEEVKNNDICLEINPISNQVLGFIRDLRLHPASTYLTRGVPCVISSDDPLIFDYKGLSYDFWEVFLAWELDLRKLKGLALNSLKYSALDEQEKEKALDYFNKRWRKFVEQALQL
jgi:adenosine deaminase CECR1